MPAETIPLRKPEDSHDGPAPQRRFGPYQIVRKLGRSMTDVYLARDTRNDRLTVLKIVEESNDPYTQQVLVAERRGAAIQRQLRDFDPRFVEIYDYGQLENAFYVAMEYVEGRSVADMLREGGRIDPDSAARIAMEICSQLEKLHSHQAEIDGRRRAIVHGDIKPSNIQMTGSGQVRLLDFGIAKVISLTRNLTHHDLGSPNYCSPERLASARVDQYADLWATGISLYEMVSGALPYQAENTRKLENIIRSKRPPRPLPAECPERLAVIIRKSLATDIKRRYPTASAFAADLECFLNNRPTIAESELRSAETNPTVESVRVIDNGAESAAPSSRDTLWQTLLHVRVPTRIGRFRLPHGAMPWFVAAGCGLLLVACAARYYQQRWSEAEPLRNHTRLARLSDTEIASDWGLFERLHARDGWLRGFSPSRIAARPLEAAYVTEGDRIIDSYRNSQEQDTTRFDWPRAQTVLEHARELHPADPSILGKLALVKGYVNLNLAIAEQTSVWQHMQDHVDRSRQEFDQAAALLPKAPDPHLGLARLYVYSYRLLDKANEEWDQAVERQYKLGPREIEQKANGFRLRAQKEMFEVHDRAAAKDDLARAKELYLSIRNYDEVSQRLLILAQDERDLNPPSPAPPARAAVRKPAARSHHASHAISRPTRRTQAWQSPKAGKRRKS